MLQLWQAGGRGGHPRRCRRGAVARAGHWHRDGSGGSPGGKQRGSGAGSGPRSWMGAQRGHGRPQGRRGRVLGPCPGVTVAPPRPSGWRAPRRGWGARRAPGTTPQGARIWALLSTTPGIMSLLLYPLLRHSRGYRVGGRIGPRCAPAPPVPGSLPGALRRRRSSRISSAAPRCSRGSGSGAHPAAAALAASAPWGWQGPVTPGGHPLLPPLPAPCTHLAMARKASSTFIPVLALVSMKGTPYSCEGGTAPSGGSPRPPPAPPKSPPLAGWGLGTGSRPLPAVPPVPCRSGHRAEWVAQPHGVPK